MVATGPQILKQETPLALSLGKTAVPEAAMHLEMGDRGGGDAREGGPALRASDVSYGSELVSDAAGAGTRLPRGIFRRNRKLLLPLAALVPAALYCVVLLRRGDGGGLERNLDGGVWELGVSELRYGVAGGGAGKATPATVASQAAPQGLAHGQAGMQVPKVGSGSSILMLCS